MTANPELSIVAVIVSDTTGEADVEHLRPCLRALLNQKNAPAMEIIVPHHSEVRGIERIGSEFPQVRFVAITNLTTYNGKPGSREHHDELRARGLALAKGNIVGILEDHGVVDANWSRRAVELHAQPYAAIGGAIENGIDERLNWAVYFCDFLRYQNPVLEGDSTFASDANVTYKRSALERIRTVWSEKFHETAVHAALRERALRLALSPTLIIRQHRRNLKLGRAVAERFIWGRSYARSRARVEGFAKRMIYAALSPAIPLVILGRMALMVRRKRRNVAPFLKALPLTTLLTFAWSVGEMVGYLSGTASTVAAVSEPVTRTSQ